MAHEAPMTWDDTVGATGNARFDQPKIAVLDAWRSGVRDVVFPAGTWGAASVSVRRGPNTCASASYGQGVPV